LIVRTRGHGWIRSIFTGIAALRQIGAVIDYVVGEPLHRYMEKAICIGIAKAEGRLDIRHTTRQAASAA
jgi:hypothetical protein